MASSSTGLPKRMKNASPDYMEKLPMGIIENIITFLPPRDAVRSCVLSKQWVKAWTSAPFHKIDLCDVVDFLVVDPKFDIFVGNFLRLANLKHVKSFCLHCGGYGELYGVELLQQWVNAGCMSSVEEVDIDLNLEETDPIILPAALRSSQYLKVLKMKANFELDLPADEVCFPHLKVLYVYVFDPRNDLFTRRLYSHCTVVEDLTIEGFMSDDGLHVEFEIASNTLKKLKVIYDSDGLADNIDYTFVIRAPNLNHVDISDNFIANYVFNDTAPLLHSARISIGDASMCPTVNEIDFIDRFDDRNPFQFLRSLSCVESLILSGSTVGALLNFAQHQPNFNSDVDDDDDDDNDDDDDDDDGAAAVIEAVMADTLPMLGGLTTLKLGFLDCCSWDLLSYILPYMPRVENLVLEKEERVPGCGEPWKVPKTVPDCLLQHMKTVEFQRFTGEIYEMAVIEYLLANGQELESMTIDIHILTVEERMMHQNTILAYPKASGECQIFFV